MQNSRLIIEAKHVIFSLPRLTIKKRPQKLADKAHLSANNSTKIVQVDRPSNVNEKIKQTDGAPCNELLVEREQQIQAGFKVQPSRSSVPGGVCTSFKLISWFELFALKSL